MLKVEYADGLYYLLGSVSSDDYTIPTPLEPQCPCGENTSNSNVLATLLKGVDGITPDMSDYYDKGVVEEKLAQKQNVITDLATIRSNASKGATALQSVPSEYVTESELSAKGYATTSQVNAKQDKISDLDTIRSGAAKGATALQSETYKGTVTGVKVNGSTKNPSNGIVDIGTVITSHQDVSGKQDKIADLDTIRSGAAKGATALQEHQPLKTINGESIVGSGNITIEGGGGGVDKEYVDNAVAEVNVKGEDGYVYSNGEKVDMRFTRSLLPVGTSIPAKANLNTIAYLKVGKYYCSLNVDAETITNCPVNVSFAMEVFNPLGTNVDDEETKAYCYRIRILTEFNTGIQYIQYCNTGATAGSWTYASWYVTPRTSFALNSSKNDGSAAKGAATRGVYIDSTGTFQQMTYTLGKSVPSNAVFTDTNTKVTSVGNHYAPAEDASVVLNAPEGEVVVGLKRDAAGHVVGVMSTPMSSGGGGGGSTITEAEIAAMGFTKNVGTITEVKMNGVSKGTSGVVDLGQVITEHQDISGKVDKVSGKGLSTEDFTTVLKSKLEGLSNYDDTALSNALTTLRNDFDKLVSGDSTTAIKTFNEIIAFLDGIADTEDLASIIASIEQQIAGKMDKVTLASVATSGSYNDLSDKPTIPSAVTESTVSGWGFTKNTGTYSKPSGGIPDTDLSEDVRSALIAAQAYKGTVNNITINGNTKAQTNGVVDLGNVVTSVKVNNVSKSPSGGVVDLGSVGTYSKPSTGIPKTDLASDVQQRLDNAVTREQFGDMEVIQTQGFNGTSSDVLYALPDDATGDEDDILLSKNSVKTINGQSIFGSGNITIEGGGSSSGGGKEYVVVEPDLSPMGSEIYISDIEPNKTYIISEPISLLHINGFGTTEAVCDEYNVIFKAEGGGTTLTIVNVDDLFWANGTIPTMEESAVYELSIQRVRISGYDMYNAVVTPFKVIE